MTTQGDGRDCSIGQRVESALAGRPAALALAALLSGCVSTMPPATKDFRGNTISDWKWEETVNPITNAVSRSAIASTANVKITGSRFAQFATVGMHCSGGTVMIMFVWSFPVGTQGAAVLSYRFAGQAGRDIPKALFFNMKSQAIQDPAEVEAFLTDAAISDNLFVRVSSLATGIADAIFMVRGGAEAVSRLRPDCPATGVGPLPTP